MKKQASHRAKHELRAALKRAARSRRRKGPGQSLDLNPIYLKPFSGALKNRRHHDDAKIQTPAKLDLYAKDNVEIFCRFLTNLREMAKYNNRIILCFRHTHRITAAAALRLLAEVSHLQESFDNLSFGCSIPVKRRGKFRNSDRAIEAILQQIGFFTLIGQPQRSPSKQADIAQWQQLSGSLADGSLAASLLNSLPASVTKKAKAHLYKGAIEAMANSADHAYPEASPGSKQENRWWMLVGTSSDKITLIVCDLGVGIPVTLPIKHPDSLLKTIFKKLRIIGNDDANLIHASTFIKRTRTNQTHRGKGGADIRSITEHFPSALLSIRSNRGCYIVAGAEREAKMRKGYEELSDTGGREWSASYNGSIRGTLIEWTVSLKELEK
ncbi:hypothetical protein ABRY74_12185 [Pseudomonas guariconensis]|uniref:hypothetical protein n=1 Tax=Pseudomonas guariconensis TaxID=1288410 RepID=UPI003EE3EE2D